MKRSTKILSLVLLVCTLLAFLPSVFSVTADAASILSDKLTEFTVSEDGETLYRNGEALVLVKVSKRLKLDPAVELEYANTLYIPYGGFGEATLHSYDRAGCFVWATNRDGKTLFYANQAGADLLLSPFGNEAALFRFLEAEHKRAAMSRETVLALDERLKNGKDLEGFKSSFLKDLPHYTIAAYDETLTVRIDHGAIYLYDDEYYYVNYLDLEDGHFDESGSFTHLRGSVIATKLDGKLTKQTEDLLDETVRYNGVSHTEGTISDIKDPSEGNSSFLFWFTFVLLGFIAPLPFLIMGLIFPCSKRRKKPKYWFAVAIAAGVWLLASIALMLMLLLF